MRKNDKPKVLSREEILETIKAREVLVEVKGWGASVRVRPPSFELIAQLKMEHPDERDFQFHLLVAAMVDLKAEDVRAMLAGNGLKYAQLLDAVLGSGSPLTDSTVGK